MIKDIRDDHIGIFDDYFGAQMCDDYISYYKELDEKMKKFLEKGKTVEKLPPGSAYNLGSLDFHGKPRYSALEIKAGKDKK